MDKHSFHQFNHANKGPRVSGGRPPADDENQKQKIIAVSRAPFTHSAATALHYQLQESFPWKQATALHYQLQESFPLEATHRSPRILGDDDDHGNSMSYMQPINLRAATNAQPGDHDPQQTYYCQYE
jgi:hypothetical protein